jgi:hypothetical protein
VVVRGNQPRRLVARCALTGVVRVNYNNSFDDYAGSPTQHTNAGWDNGTGLGTPKGAFFTLP